MADFWDGAPCGLVSFHQSARRINTEDGHLRTRRTEDLQSHESGTSRCPIRDESILTDDRGNAEEKRENKRIERQQTWVVVLRLVHLVTRVGPARDGHDPTTGEHSCCYNRAVHFRRRKQFAQN